MGFYDEWKNSEYSNEKKYIKSFLDCTDDSLEVFDHGSIEELTITVKLLLNIPIKKFVDEINTLCDYAANDLIQYSNFDHAITNVCSVISFSKRQLAFSELGKAIMHSKLDGACKKYGENHAKLAKELSLVKFNKNASFVVQNTALGEFTLKICDDDKYELVKRLGLRNKFIQALIYYAKNDVVYYDELALKVVSISTSVRRKPNIKYLVSLILEGNKEILNNIMW